MLISYALTERVKHLKPTDALPRIAAHAVRRIGEVSALLTQINMPDNRIYQKAQTRPPGAESEPWMIAM